jgi:hypothetical protein
MIASTTAEAAGWTMPAWRRAAALRVADTRHRSTAVQFGDVSWVGTHHYRASEATMADGDRNPGRARSSAQEAIFALLTDKIRQDPHPSSTMLDIVESHMTEEQLPRYLDVLMEKIKADDFPSLDMIRRVLALT